MTRGPACTALAPTLTAVPPTWLARPGRSVRAQLQVIVVVSAGTLHLGRVQALGGDNLGMQLLVVGLQLLVAARELLVLGGARLCLQLQHQPDHGIVAILQLLEAAQQLLVLRPWSRAGRRARGRRGGSLRWAHLPEGLIIKPVKVLP